MKTKQRRRFVPVVISEAVLDGITKSREDAHAEAKRGDWIKVEGYRRFKGQYLSVQQRKATYWYLLERLLRLADVFGVTESDRKSAAIAIAMIDDTFKPEGVRVTVSNTEIRAIDRPKAAAPKKKAAA